LIGCHYASAYRKSPKANVHTCLKVWKRIKRALNV
jgi:hypothetical protein